MAATVVRMPVHVELTGRRLKRNKVFEVGDGRKKEKMTQAVDFWCQVLVMAVSEERHDRDHGPYRSVWVKLEDGVTGYPGVQRLKLGALICAVSIVLFPIAVGVSSGMVSLGYHAAAHAN